MSKANRKARFAIFNFFDMGRISLPEGLDRKLTHLDYDETIERVPKIKQALKDIKQRKRLEKHLLNLHKFNYPNTHMYKEIIKVKNTMTKLDKEPIDQIQYGFDLANWWNEQHE